MVRAMKYRIYGAFIASLGAAAFLLAADETFARSGSAPHGRFASPHSKFRPFVGHHRRNRNDVALWPATDGYFYGPPDGEPLVDVTQPVSGSPYSYDVPWDWAHRYPLTLPSERPYVPSCTVEAVTVPGRYGMEQTVNVTRCY